MKVRSDVPFSKTTPEEQTYMEWLRKLGLQFQYSDSEFPDHWVDIAPYDTNPLGYDPHMHYRLKPTDDP